MRALPKTLLSLALCAACVLPAQARFVRSFWMSMPAEAKSVARLKAVWDFLREAVQARQAQLLLDADPAALRASSASQHAGSG